MAKYLKDILKAAHDQIKGVRPSETGPLSTGKDPGVDYMPKAGDEADFIAKHSVQKWDEPYGNPNYSNKVGYTLDKEKNHGNTESKAKAANEEYDLDEAMSPKQKQYSNRVKTMPGKKGAVMAKSNFEAPFHKVHATVSKNGGSKEVVKHELQAKDKHDAVFNVQLMHHKAGHKVHDVKHKGMVKEEIDTAFSESKKAEDVSCNHTPAGTKCPMHEMADCTMSRTIKEGGMPASVIKSKQHRANMSDKEFADSHKDKSDADLRSMAWRHGHGKPGTPGHDHYVNRRNRGLKEEIEQIDELSKKTLGSYIQGATRDALSRQYALGKGDKSDTRKLMNRRKGIDKAVDKMANEEVEQVNELSTDLLHRAAHKAAKRAMGDAQGRSGPIFKKYATMANKFRAKGMEQEKKEKAIKEETGDKNHKPLSNWPKVHAAVHHSFSQAGGTGTDLEKKELGKTPIHPDHHAVHNDAESDSKKMRKVVNRHYSHDVSRGLNEDGPVAPVPAHLDSHGIAKKYKDYVTGGGTPDTASRYKSHVNMHAKKTGQLPDAIDKEVRKHVKDMKEETVEEGANVDRMVAHVKSSEKAAGKSDKKAENIAWATANKRGMLDNKNKKVEEGVVPEPRSQLPNHGLTNSDASKMSKVAAMLKKEKKSEKIKTYRADRDKHMEEAYAVEPLLGGDSDHDEGAEMVKAELKAIANKAMHLVMKMPDSMHVEPWCQAKIAQAKSMINDVHDYMIYGNHKDEEDEQMDTPMTLPNMSVDVNTGRNV
jgi:predicted transcriptional regulator